MVEFAYILSLADGLGDFLFWSLLFIGNHGVAWIVYDIIRRIVDKRRGEIVMNTLCPPRKTYQPVERVRTPKPVVKSVDPTGSERAAQVRERLKADRTRQTELKVR